MDTAVLMEIENLRRASLAALREKYREVFREETRCRHREHLFRRIAWRLQALAEGDLSERARGRAQQIARDADLRMVAPRDFFTVDGERVQTTRGNRNRRPPDRRLPLAGHGAQPEVERTNHSGRGPGGRDSGMRTGIIPRSARSPLRSPAPAGTAWPSSG